MTNTISTLAMRLHFYAVRGINCSSLEVQAKTISNLRTIGISQLTVCYTTTFPRSRAPEDWRVLRAAVTPGFIPLSNEGPPVLSRRRVSTIRAYHFVFEGTRECGDRSRCTGFSSLKHSCSVESLVLAENVIGEVFGSFFLSGSIQLGYGGITG
jgi:hypothetical protein